MASNSGAGLWSSVRLAKHLNFYRVHSLFFTFTPLIFSAIFYASNGQYKISYIDSLFNCVSAMTVCGLATVDLSSLTPWQQVILFIQMCLGSPVVVSWLMVYIRKYYFEQKFEFIIEAEAARKAAALADQETTLSNGNVGWPRRVMTMFSMTAKDKSANSERQDSPDQPEKESRGFSKLRPDMIRRMDDAPKLVNPSGWISEGDRITLKRSGTVHSTSRRLSFAPPPLENTSRPSVLHSTPPVSERPRPSRRRLSDPGAPPAMPSTVAIHRFETVSPSRTPPLSPIQAQAPTTQIPIPRTQTVEFNLPRRRPLRVGTTLQEHGGERPEPEPLQHEDRRSTIRAVPFGPSTTNHTYSTYLPDPIKGTKNSGFGGFPMPHEIIQKLFKKLFPNLGRRLTRTITMPRTMTIASSHGTNLTPGARPVPYISFEAVVGRNSAFPELTDEQMEELGGVEYRALNALLWIVAGYHILAQLIPFVVIAPYISQAKWRDNFRPDNLHKPVSPVWYSLFQVVSAYTNTGMSLVDQSMVPFQKAYVLILALVYLILAGNTAFPILLRFTIWILTKLVPETSRANETLHFLLDHPRRCYLYLFPSHQTWFLLTIVVTLTCTDWFFFMVLDIGTSAIESIPLGRRFLAGLLQAVAVRAAGFGIVPLAALAPGVKVLYVIMMYISVFPIAMSVRSTNVYEEQSLGVYNGENDSDEITFQSMGESRMTVWSRYLTMHARKQLAFDMWWLCMALFLVCIIERRRLEDPETASWFNIFNIIFELVSAYGTVGLSLGLPDANYSFCGSFSTLSKLIVCAVMLRGRHRGLPVAIDRAVMLPQEWMKRDEPVGLGGNDDSGSFYARSTGRQHRRGQSTASNWLNPERGNVVSEEPKDLDGEGEKQFQGYP